MSLRVRVARVVVLAGVLALLAGALPGVASAGSCPNEEVRAEQGAGRLPDCRAFELVTPEIKGDNSSIGAAFGNPYGFPDGNHVSYESLLPLPGAQSGGQQSLLSTRTAAGWVNTALGPPAVRGEPIGLFNSGLGGGSNFEATFTGDFSEGFVNSTFDIDPRDQDGAFDAYRRDLSSGAWSLAALPDTGPMTKSLNFEPSERDGTFIAGVSASGSHVLFQTFDQLPVAPGTPSEPHPSDMLYDRTGGHTYAVGVLPNGTISPTCGVEIGDGGSDTSSFNSFKYGAISPDGTNVVFTLHCAEEASGGVYLRESNATTIKLAGDRYIARSSDGSKVFTVREVGGGVYEYDVASGTTTIISTEGRFVASSADGSRVYYLSAEVPILGEENKYEVWLYLWDKGTSTLIPKAGEGFSSYVNPAGNYYASKGDQPVATPDGSRLLFLDRASLTGYDNFGPKCVNASTQPGFCAEAYVYDATTGSITCVSCNPIGAPPLGLVHLMGLEQKNSLLPGYSEGEISPDGSRVFFETRDALVSQDTNGLEDVYEWENGRIYLISSGQGTSGSVFSGASSNGNDVFVTTNDHLAPQDIENSTQVYDARVGGGFPYRPFTTGCDSGQCQGPQTPVPVFGAPASATFVGLGNPVPAAAVKPAVKAKPKKKTKPQRTSKKKRWRRSKAARIGGRARAGGSGERKGGK